MARQKLTYTFHNPNTEEETLKYISALLAESVVNKVSHLAVAEEPLIEPAVKTA